MRTALLLGLTSLALVVAPAYAQDVEYEGDVTDLRVIRRISSCFSWRVSPCPQDRLLGFDLLSYAR
jgi:hypothetical protein